MPPQETGRNRRDVSSFGGVERIGIDDHDPGSCESRISRTSPMLVRSKRAPIATGAGRVMGDAEERLMPLRAKVFSASLGPMPCSARILSISARTSSAMATVILMR